MGRMATACLMNESSQAAMNSIQPNQDKPSKEPSPRRIDTQIHRRKKAKPVSPLTNEWENSQSRASQGLEAPAAGYAEVVARSSSCRPEHRRRRRGQVAISTVVRRRQDVLLARLSTRAFEPVAMFRSHHADSSSAVMPDPRRTISDSAADRLLRKDARLGAFDSGILGLLFS